MDTRTHTPVRPSSAERARTVLAAAASASVLWDDGRVDLLGCHHDDPLGNVILTLDATSSLVRAVQAAAEASRGDLSVSMQLTELCAVSARERVRARLTLGGRMLGTVLGGTAAGSVSLRVDVTDILIEDDGALLRVSPPDYRVAEPDPLSRGSAEELQHLAAHHSDAIDLLSRLCEREALIGVTRVLPIALDRYGIVLRVERRRDHRDVRLPFRIRVDHGVQAAQELCHLLNEAHRRRPCGR